MRNRSRLWMLLLPVFRAAALTLILLPVVGPIPTPLKAATQGGGSPPPIDVKAAPSRTLPGGKVTFSGEAVPLGPGSQVAVTVKPPGGAPPAQLTAPLDQNGRYSTVFPFPQAAPFGTYQIQVTAPDGKATASTTVTVVAPGVIPAEVTQDIRSLLEAVEEAVQVVGAELDGLPSSSELEEAKAKLNEAEGRTGDALSQLPDVQEQMTKVFEARAAVEEDNPAWDEYMEELEVWEEEAPIRLQELRATIKGVTGGTERCGTMDRIVEGLTLASEATNYANIPLDKSQGYWVDKIPTGFVARAFASSDYKPATKYLAITTMKTAANFILGGPKAVVESIPGLVGDAIQLVAQEVYSAYCEKLEGPISVTFLGESFTTQGEPFLDYTTTLDGKLVLMYEKDLPGNQSIGLLGYIEGNGQFEVRDNPEPVIRLTPGEVLFHKVISPPGTRYWDEVGQFSRALLPHSFRIPLKGVLAGDSVVFNLEAAAHDFSDAIQGRSIYVVMPLGGLVPQIIDSPVPLQKAYPMIERTVRRYPVLRVTRGAKETVVEGTFARDTTNAAGTARVRTQITFKACSPGCLPLPFTSPAKKGEGKEEEIS